MQGARSTYIDGIWFPRVDRLPQLLPQTVGYSRRGLDFPVALDGPIPLPCCHSSAQPSRSCCGVAGVSSKVKYRISCC
jgi:hypothetical protein